jgi:nitronate monooxygenase
MWPRRRLCDLLRIDHPIIQAPMARADTPELAAAVSNAGGLGSLACSQQPPEAVRALTARLRAATGRPFNLNFFCHPVPRADPARLAEAIERLRPYYVELGIGAPPSQVPATGPGFDATRLVLLLELRPPVASFHFGGPEPAAIRALKAAGIVLLGTATTVAEARSLEAAGFDAVIAQGWEAGGHRGSHTWSAPTEGIGTLALVPQVADAVRPPVIAAGGIADGRGIAAALALGACGVQLGTAFLVCPEAATDPARRAALAAATDEDTILTDAVTGRPARARRSRYASEMAGHRLPDFPSQLALTGPLLEAAGRVGNPDFAFHVYGQSAALSRPLPAAELVRLLVAETREVLGQLGS